MAHHHDDRRHEIPDLMDTDVHNRLLADGAKDGLIPLESLDVNRIGDFDEMLQAMAHTAFGGRNLGEAADVLVEMITDPDCVVVLTLSGAMTVAKMGLVITEMIERGWVQAVVSTGALMTHGLVEGTGMVHYKASRELDDTTLYNRGYNRVYDTYEMEKNLNDLAAELRSVFDLMPADRRWGSRMLLETIGEYLAQKGGRGVIPAAWRSGVPVYIPAFSDSELALDVATWVVGKRLRSDPDATLLGAFEDLTSPFDPFLDLGHYARMVTMSPRLGIFTIGGGVPRNWAQQAPPFLDIINHALDENAPLNRFRYGIRICPEPVHWGGLSGCTYSEGVSWGKFMPQSEGGRFAEVHSDATTVWPLLVKGVAQRLEKMGKKAVSPKLDLPGCSPRG